MTFTWTPTFEDARFDDEGNPIPYDPVFTLTDTEGGTDQITAYITVGDVNRGPIIPNPIADMELPEDSDAVQVPLVDVFSDPDGDLLTLTLVDPPDDLGLEIVMGNLVIHPIANLNTHGTDPFTIIIRATDDADIPAFVDDEFLLTIYDLNDPPDPFALLAPDAGFTVTDDVEELTFQWEDATPADNPWEPDAVYYIFVLRDQEFPDDSVAIPMMDMTEFAVTKQGILDTLEFEEHQIFKTLEWYVRAIDDSMAFVDATDSPRVLNLVLVVEDQYGPAIPNVYFLSPSFPNPFNARTTVRFGLPTPGATSVTVWDMHGRRVADLTSGHHSAGRYSVVWDAQSVTSGVYIIKLESGSFKAMQKAVLLR